MEDSGDDLHLCPDWFSDPLGNLREGAAQRRQQLASLLETLLGSAAGSSVSAPGGNGSRTWYPLRSASGTPSGLYVVIDPQPNFTVLGLGVSRQWVSQPGGVSVSVSPVLYAPLFQLADDGNSMVLGASGFPLEIGVRVAGSPGMFGAGDVSFDGLKVSVSLGAGVTPVPDVVLLNLKLPGRAAADRSLASLLSGSTADEWVLTAVSMLGAKLAAAHPEAANMVASLLKLSGISGELPHVVWADLKDRPAAALVQWLRQVAGSPETAKAWLSALQSLLPAPSAGAVSGAGTRLDPWSISLAQADGVSLRLQLGAEARAGGELHVYPGIAVATQPVQSSLPVAFRFEAAMEAAQLILQSDGSASAAALPTFDFLLTAAQAGDLSGPLFSVPDPDLSSAPTGLDSGNRAFSVGRLEAGVGYRQGAITPIFRAVDVRTPSGSWPSVDLKDVQNSAAILKDVAADVVTRALQTALGNSAIAVALGLIAPADWTEQWPTPLLPEYAAALIDNPLETLARFYGRALQAGSPVWSRLLGAMASLLGANVPTAAGDGTAASPWRIALRPGDPSTRLEVFQPESDPRLRFALAVPVQTSGSPVQFDLRLELLELDLSQSRASASWLPSLGARLTVTGAAGAPLMLGPLGGFSVEAPNALLQATWDRRYQFRWGARITGVTVKLAGLPDSPVGDLEFGPHGLSWNANQVTALTQAALAALGLRLFEQGGRFGVTLCSALGLLPQLQQAMQAQGVAYDLPAGFSLPDQWPLLTVTDPAAFLQNPWPLLRSQFLSLFTDGDRAGAFLRLLGWAVTGTLPALPSTVPQGSAEDPWSVLLPNAWNLELLAWKAQQFVGFGLRRTMAAAAPGASIQARIVMRVDPASLPLEVSSGGSAAPPRATIVCHLSNPSGPLVDQGGVQLGSADLGVEFTFSDGLQIAPILQFHDAQLPGIPPALVQLTKAPDLPSYVCAQGRRAIDALVNALMQELSAAAAAAGADPNLQRLFSFLADLSLAQRGPTGYGINAGAWESLLANPASFLSSQAAGMLGNPATRAGFQADLLALIGYPGFQLPAALQGLPDLLAALGLMETAGGGFVLKPSAWLDLASHPVAYLESRGRQFISSEAARTALLTRLSQLPKPDPSARLACGFSTATTIDLQIPAAQALAIGGPLRMNGGLHFDTAAAQMGGQIEVWSSQVGVSVVFRWQLGAAIPLSLWLSSTPDGGPPAFSDIQIFPFACDLASLGERLPTLMLSAVLSKLLNERVLPEYPLMADGLRRLGLATQLPGEAAARVHSIVGVLRNPVGWMLGAQALGDGKGRLDLDKLGTLLNAFAGGGKTWATGISLTADGGNGLVVAGLPFGITLGFHAAKSSGASIAAGVTADHGGLQIRLSPAVAFGLQGGVAVSGDAAIDCDAVSGRTVSILASYKDAGFTLRAGLAGGKLIPLVPFGGLNSFLSAAGDIAENLVNMVARKAIAAYRAHRSALSPSTAAVIDDVIACANALDVADLGAIVAAAQAIVSDPVQWMSARSAAALPAVGALIKNTFRIPGFDVTGQLLTYTPTVSSGTCTISFGSTGKGTVGIQVAPSFQNGWFGFEPKMAVTMPWPLRDTPSVVVDVQATIDQVGLNVGLHGGVPRLSLYPAGQADGALGIDFLPQFQWLGAADAQSWLMRLCTGFLAPRAAEAILAKPPVASFLDYAFTSGSPSVTPGAILTKWGLLSKDAGLYSLAAFTELTAEGLLEAVLSTLTSGVPIVPIGKYGIYAVNRGTDYGLRIQIEDLAVPGCPLPGSAEAAAPGAKPAIAVQLGKAQSTANGGPTDSWLTQQGLPNAVPGITVFLLRMNGSTPSLRMSLEVASIGVDCDGPSGKPLVAVGGFQLGSIEPRLYLAMDSGGVKLGAAVQCDRLGIPLAPKFGSGAGQNPVAQNLLGSASSPSGGDAGGSGAVNPTFAARFSYLQSLKADLYQTSGISTKTGDKLWFPVQRSFGPVQCRQVGLQWQDASSNLWVLFDGAVSLGGLSIDLMQLGVGIPVRNPARLDSYALDLQGLDVSFSGGSASINAGLVKTDPASYAGQAMVRAASFTLGAVGAYSVVHDSQRDYTSLFVFAFLDKPLGGPSFFFVTGVAAGFGFNSAILLPAPDQVQEFPLVKGVIQGGLFTDSAAGNLQSLGSAIQAQAGSTWLAAGVRFNSFQLIHSFALLVIQFGRDFEIELMGVSELRLPKDSGDSALMYAQLSMLAVFKPSEGVLGVMAILTPNSYVLDHDCRLTGGFAFYTWFSGPHSGDFVVTLGGYHPAFVRPSHYPSVPRLGFSWPVSGNVLVEGQAYFALTPSCVMAGGRLDVTFHSGDLRAWLHASADMLISWEPFHYDIAIGVSIGASYKIHLIVTVTLEVELSVNLHIWGPRLRGEAEVHWTVISFTVGFGSGGDSPDTTASISWTQFCGRFLATKAPGATTLSNPNPAVLPEKVLRIRPVDGVMNPPQGGELGPWKVRADRFALSVESLVPATYITATAGSVWQSAPGPALGIKPIGCSELASSISVNITGAEAAAWSWQPNLAGVPAALWDPVNDGQASPGSKLLAGVMTGLRSGSPTPKTPAGPVACKLTDFAYTDLPGVVQLPLDASRQDFGPAPTAVTDPDTRQTIERTIMSQNVIQSRSQALRTARQYGFDVAPDGTLYLLAATARQAFLEQPLVRQLAPRPAAIPRPYVPPSPPEPVAVSAATPSPASARLRAVVRRYSHTDGVVSSKIFTQARLTDLLPGETALWELNREAPILPKGLLRVVALDQHQRVIEDATASAEEIAIPSGAAHLAIVGQDPDQTGPRTVGWNLSTSLVAIKPKVLLGDGVVVRPQSPLRFRASGQRIDLGVTNGAAMVAANRVQGAGSALERGWIETILPAAVRMVTVLMRRERPDATEAPACLTVSLPVEDPGGIPGRIRLQASETLVSGGEARVSYSIPPLRGETRFLHLFVAADGWVQEGLIGVTEDGGKERG